MTGTRELKRHPFFQYFRMPPPAAAGVRRPPEEAEAELKMVEKGLSKLAAITIEYVVSLSLAEISEFHITDCPL